MQTSVLHCYYRLGGERLRDALFTIDQHINMRVAEVPHAVEHTIPYIDESAPLEVARTSIRAHRIPAYHYQDPDSLKLSLFYLKGSPGKIEYVRTQLNQNTHSRRPGARQSGAIPWGQNGVIDYLDTKYPFESLVFNGLRYEYDGLDMVNQPIGSVRMELDEEAEENQSFFNAQTVCFRALRAISARVGIEQADSIQVGRINMQNTSEAQVEAAVADASMELAEMPVTARVGGLVLKHKTL